MVGRVLPFLAYGWILQVAINNRGNKAYVLIQKQSHLFLYSNANKCLRGCVWWWWWFSIIRLSVFKS